jgi:uncharacterized SAM-binding protein YcdF (DUF218 family)
MRRRRRWIGILGWVVLALLLSWAAGLAWFIRDAARSDPAPPRADGIVALTGGADRVETALRLLAAGRAQWLLVSGIGPSTELAALARRADLNAAPLASQIQLGRQATSTRGNAAETAAWVRAKDIHSLIVVTAWYHMPRALTEIGRAVPGVAVYPAPVDPEGSRRPSLTLAHLLAEEYIKYLVARLDLTALLPERPRTPARR